MSTPSRSRVNPSGRVRTARRDPAASAVARRATRPTLMQPAPPGRTCAEAARSAPTITVADLARRVADTVSAVPPDVLGADDGLRSAIAVVVDRLFSLRQVASAPGEPARSHRPAPDAVLLDRAAVRLRTRWTQSPLGDLPAPAEAVRAWERLERIVEEPSRWT